MNREAAILQDGGWTPFRSPASSHRPTSPLLRIRMLFDGSVIVKFVVTILDTFGDDTQKNSSGHAQSQLVIYLEVPFWGGCALSFCSLWVHVGTICDRSIIIIIIIIIIIPKQKCEFFNVSLNFYKKNTKQNIYIYKISHTSGGDFFSDFPPGSAAVAPRRWLIRPLKDDPRRWRRHQPWTLPLLDGWNPIPNHPLDGAKTL